LSEEQSRDPRRSRPASILLFERLFLFTILIGVVQAILGWEELSRRGSTGEVLTLLALSLGTLGAVALLVSRGRSRSAKWLLVLLLLIGLPLFLTSLSRGTLVGWAPLSLVQAAFQAVSIAFLFTSSARQWLRGGERP
jgi:hypothetical protein